MTLVIYNLLQYIKLVNSALRAPVSWKFFPQCYSLSSNLLAKIGNNLQLSTLGDLRNDVEMFNTQMKHRFSSKLSR